MRRPPLPLPTWVYNILHRLYHHTTSLLHVVIDALQHHLSPYLPSRKAVQGYAILWWRRFAGFSAALFLTATPILLYILLEELSIISSSRTDRSSIANFYFELSEIATIVLFVALFAVYFLRIVYWFQKTLPRFWNRVTPPHVHEEPAKVDRPVAVVFEDAERNVRKWFGRGVLFFGGILIILVVIGFTLDRAGLQPQFQQHVIDGPSENGFLSSFPRVLALLPMVGELYSFAGELPGENAFEKFIFNGTAVFFAIALRNWAYMFEHTDHIYAEVSWGRPFRYLLYIPFYLLATLLTSLLLIMLIAAEFAIV